MRSQYNLGFISDEDLIKHISETINSYRFDINLESFNQNLIDPIKLTFDSKIYNTKIEDLIESEILRQINKSNSNRIGYFNQNIFKYIGGNAWEVPKTGFDLINKEKNIYVEMKNKHNTMNSASSQKTYMSMQNIILRNSDAVCMLVEVIAKKSQNSPWQISLNGESIKHDKIRRVSIDKFYELVTNDKFAFKKLVEILPQAISDCIEINFKEKKIKNTVLEELKEISPDILKSLYLLGFKKYEGFSEIHFQ